MGRLVLILTLCMVILSVNPVSIGAQQPSWIKIEPGGDTTCAHGTSYAYWVHEGDPDKLMIYFEGGGGCWNAETCRDTGRKFNGFYDSAVGESDSPAYSQGVLDLNHPENPFADYSMLFIPVCTGDVHMGANVHTYDDDVTIHFNGFVNAATALEWAYENVPNPDTVFVTGCSAGSVGSIVHAPYIIEHYPDANVYQFGDSLSLLFTTPVDLQTDWGAHDNFPSWIPALATMQPRDWTMARHYIAVANHYPDHTFSQFNSIRDSVQVFYTFPNGEGTPAEWTMLLDAHLAEVQSHAPNYRSFTPGGALHCITPRSQFYDYAIDGIRIRDWVADLVSGVEVPILHCEDCEVAERIRP